jgi:hypothetical protein
MGQPPEEITAQHNGFTDNSETHFGGAIHNSAKTDDYSRRRMRLWDDTGNGYGLNFAPPHAPVAVGKK